jgi:hypothetical protein
MTVNTMRTPDAADDTRPVLRFNNPDYITPVVPTVLAAMRAHGFYIRVRCGLKPALWRMTERGTFTPVRVPMLQFWIAEHFRCYDESRGAFSKAPRQLASWIISVEIHCDSHGLQKLDDAMLELV